MEYPRDPVVHRRSPGCLHSDQRRHCPIGESGECAGGIRSTPGTRHHHVRILAIQDLAALGPGLVPHYPLQFTHHPWIWVGAHHRPQAVVGGVHRCDPVPEGFVDRILEGATATIHRTDFGPQEFHPEHIEGLALHVHRPHIDHAFHPEQCRSGSRGHAVLTGTRLGDQALLAHPTSEEGLTYDIVDLVGAGMSQVLALQQHPNAQLLGETQALSDRGGPTTVRVEKVIELTAKCRIDPGLAKRGFELHARGHQRLGDEPTAELAEAPGWSRVAHDQSGLGHGASTRMRTAHSSCQSNSPAPPSGSSGRPVDSGPAPPSLPAKSSALVSARRTAEIKSRSFPGSLTPGDDSTPLDTSTPHGCRWAMA